MKADTTSRRAFLKQLAVSAAALATSGAGRGYAAALTGARLRLRLRHDMIADAVMAPFLGRFNRSQRDVRVDSSFVPTGEDWGNTEADVYRLPAMYVKEPAWDILLCRAEALPILADTNKIVPLDDYLARSSELPKSDFHRGRYQSVLDTATWRGRIWGIPVEANPYALFCNRRLFREAGIEKFPADWNNVLKDARRLLRDTNGDGKPDVFGYTQCSFQFALEFLSYGVDLVDVKRKRVHFAGDAGVQALETYGALVRTSPPHVDFERDDVGMKVSVAGNTYGRYARLDYATTGLPAGKRHANTYGDSDGAVVLAIAAGSDSTRRDAAWRFIEWFSGPDNFFRILPYTRSLPVRLSLRQDARYKRHIAQNPHLKTFLAEMDFALARPCIPEYRFIKTVLREILYPVQGEGPQVKTRKDIQTFLRKQTDRVNRVLEKSKW